MILLLRSAHGTHLPFPTYIRGIGVSALCPCVPGSSWQGLSGHTSGPEPSGPACPRSPRDHRHEEGEDRDPMTVHRERASTELRELLAGVFAEADEGGDPAGPVRVLVAQEMEPAPGRCVSCRNPIEGERARCWPCGEAARRVVVDQRAGGSARG